MPPNFEKTLVGPKLIETLKTSTLVLVENLGSANSWLEEIEDKTDLAHDSVVILLNEQLKSKPITIAPIKMPLRIRRFYTICKIRIGA